MRIEPIECPPQIGVPGCKAFRMNGCNILVSKDPVTERGIIVMRWHLSISHLGRYPTWSEIKEARYTLLPDEVTMAMLLPPKEQYVNVHENCFHLHEIEGE